MRIWIRDPEWKKFGSRIWDKHPGYATLFMIWGPGTCLIGQLFWRKTQHYPRFAGSADTTLSSFCRICWQRWTPPSGRQRNCCCLSLVDCLSPSLLTKVNNLTIYFKSNLIISTWRLCTMDSLSPGPLHIRFVFYKYFFIGIVQSLRGRVIITDPPINLLLGLIVWRLTSVLSRRTFFL